MNKKITILMMALLLTGSLSGCLGNGDKGDDDETDTVPVYEPTPDPDSDHLVNANDYNVLYIGHSFGRVFAETLQDYAHTAGVHRSRTVHRNEWRCFRCPRCIMGRRRPP